jgi:hypothetical protein
VLYLCGSLYSLVADEVKSVIILTQDNNHYLNYSCVVQNECKARKQQCFLGFLAECRISILHSANSLFLLFPQGTSCRKSRHRIVMEKIELVGRQWLKLLLTLSRVTATIFIGQYQLIHAVRLVYNFIANQDTYYIWVLTEILGASSNTHMLNCKAWWSP